MSQLVNPTPVVHAGPATLNMSAAALVEREEAAQDVSVRDPIDQLEVFEYLRHIKDPEHPNTLEQLRVIEPAGIVVDDAASRIQVRFTPTVPHCSMTTLIGLCIRVRLLRSLPARFKVHVQVTPGSHDQEVSVNKQLCDKERVAAALENPGLVNVVHSCIGWQPDG